MLKNIYLLTLKGHGYDEYDAWVVIADNEEEVKKLCDISKEKAKPKQFGYVNNQYEDNIESIKLIGITKAMESKIVLGSYNAG
jgi:hypothetical protein